MAETASNLSVPLLEAASPSIYPIEISFPLPKTPHTTVHVHLTPLATSTMVFLSTTTPADSGATMKSLGSFVYAMPDRTNPKSVISTVLCRSGGSLDYANRAARVLALRTKLPVYVGCNLDPGSTGTTAEEEMEGFSKIIDAVMKNWDASRLPA